MIPSSGKCTTFLFSNSTKAGQGHLAPDWKKRVGTCSNLLGAATWHDMRISLSYLMLSSLRLTRTLLHGPLCNLPQPLNREQRLDHWERPQDWGDHHSQSNWLR